MIETRILDTSNNQETLLQLKFDRTDINFRPYELIVEIRTSLAEKIAA